MRIIAVGKSRESLQELQQMVLGSGVLAQNLLPIVCDTSKEGEVMTLPKIVTQRWPNASSVNILINVTCMFSCILDFIFDHVLKVVSKTMLDC